MKKKISKIISFILLAAMLVAVFSACDGKTDDAFHVTKPSNLRFENGEFLWDKVDNADEYILSINGEQIVVSGTSYSDFTPNTEYTVSVKARNVWYTSEWSDTKKAIILSTPTNFVYFNGKFYWDEKENSSFYKVNIDGEEYDLPKTNISEFEFFSSGNKSARIKAVGDGITYFDSPYSEEITVRIAETKWETVESLAPSGDGKEASPYKINSLSNLKWFSDNMEKNYKLFEGKHFVMNYDIDLRYVTGFVPLGTSEKPFLGKFDGQGHGIYYLTIEATSAGIFGCIGENASVLNLNNVGGVVKGITTAGGIAASNLGLIIGCNNSAVVSGNTAGGIAGENTDSNMILSCVNTGNVSGENVGGIVGWNWNGTINKCVNRGEITAANNAGGLVGTNAGNVFYSENYGFINGVNAGGVAASNLSAIVCSSNNGSVLSGKLGGGIAALNAGEIKYSYNAADVVSFSNYNEKYVGGLVGRMDDGKIILAYSVGTAEYGIDTSKIPGAIIGYYRSGLMTDCYYKYGETPIGNTNKYIGDCVRYTEEQFASLETLTLYNSLVDKSSITLIVPALFIEGEKGYPVFYWQN